MPAPSRRKIKRYGWIPDLPDRRDRIFAARPDTLRTLPPRVDMRDVCPPIYDQGALGSCTAQAIAALLQFDQAKQAQPAACTPSRLFIYYNERVIEGTVDDDSGAMLRDGIKSVARQGAPQEPLWPYRIPRFRDKPPAAAYREGLKHQALLYERLLQDVDQLKGCLAGGYPFVFGFSVYESFESAGLPAAATCRCLAGLSLSLAATPSWRSATTSRSGDSSSGIRGARPGGAPATARCRTSICSTTVCRTTSGR